SRLTSLLQAGGAGRWVGRGTRRTPSVARASPAAGGADLGVHGSDGGQVDDAAGGAIRGQDVGRLVEAHQDRADRYAVGGNAEHVVGDVGGVEVGHHEQVGAAVQTRVREGAAAKGV